MSISINDILADLQRQISDQALKISDQALKIQSLETALNQEREHRVSLENENKKLKSQVKILNDENTKLKSHGQSLFKQLKQVKHEQEKMADRILALEQHRRKVRQEKSGIMSSIFGTVFLVVLSAASLWGVIMYSHLLEKYLNFLPLIAVCFHAMFRSLSKLVDESCALYAIRQEEGAIEKSRLKLHVD